MTRFLLDSGVVNDYIAKRNGVYERARAELLRGNRVGTAIPILAELAAGIELSKSRNDNMKALQLATNALTLWPFDEAAAYEYGRVYAELQRIGRPMQKFDIMLAAVVRAWQRRRRDHRQRPLRGPEVASREVDRDDCRRVTRTPARHGRMTYET